MKEIPYNEFLNGMKELISGKQYMFRKCNDSVDVYDFLVMASKEYIESESSISIEEKRGF